MAPRKPANLDALVDAEPEVVPVYRYEYSGTQPVVFPELTGLGISLVEPGDVIEVPEPISHPELLAADDVTSSATAELVKWAAALDAEANGRTNEPIAVAVDEAIPAESDADSLTDPPLGAGDGMQEEPDTGATAPEHQE